MAGLVTRHVVADREELESRSDLAASDAPHGDADAARYDPDPTEVLHPGDRDEAVLHLEARLLVPEAEWIRRAEDDGADRVLAFDARHDRVREVHGRARGEGEEPVRRAFRDLERFR